MLQRRGREIGPQLRGGSLDILWSDAMHLGVQLLQSREATIKR